MMSKEKQIEEIKTLNLLLEDATSRSTEDERRCGMREILFRGKRTDTGEWIEGYFEKYNGCAYINLQTERLNSGGYPIREFVKAIPETVGQYTGLTDKNGKKIFEGDICKHRSDYSGEYIISVVAYEDGEFLAMVGNNSAFCLSDKLEVIGNIHDNPELLN